MSKVKKVLLMCTAYVLVAAIAIGGTIAYFSSTDSDVNVMTMGNVKIEQIEQQYDENGNLVDFVQDKALYPYVGEFGWKNTDKDNGAYRQFTMNNVVDKYVSVKNTGKSDAYVRTFIALEMGDFTAAEFDKIGISINAENGSEFKFPGAWNIVNDFVEVIDGYTYNVMELVHSAPLKPGETTIPSLLQVYLSKDATNEDVEKLDGNGNGKYDILVLSQATQTAGFENANDAFQKENTTYATAKYALDTAFGAPKDINAETGVALCAEWLGTAVDNYEASLVDTWDGTSDTTWYNETDTTFTLNSAEQLAGLADLVDAGNTFEGKTITLSKSVDLGAVDAEGNKIQFNPIGHSANGKAFKGTCDGQGNTISNMYQQSNLDSNNGGWLYEGQYYGLFAYADGAEIKGLTIADAYVSSGRNEAACVVGNAVNTKFSDINIFSSTLIAYNNSAGGVASECYGECSFSNIVVDENTVIGPLWGTYDVRLGGVVGMVKSSDKVNFSNITVACQLDAINDVASNYQWYNYRYSGMLIGQVDGVNGVADPTGYVTCKNVTVIYSDWVNYHYCEDSSYGTPSYASAGQYKFNRVEAGTGTDGIDLSTCDHDENETHNLLLVFDQLFGGGQGVSGLATYDGVNVIKK